MEDAPRPPILYTNRELSWLAFNRRVLGEAARDHNPLLERVKFLSISASNLDEFFMVRYASLRHRMLRGDEEQDASGMTPREQVQRISEDARRFMEEQIEMLRLSILPALSREGLRIWPLISLNAEQLRWAETAFRTEILPCMAPHIQAEDVRFPQVAGRALQFGLLLTDEKTNDTVLATAQAPSGMKRLWALPRALGGGFIYLEDMITLFAQAMVPGYRVEGCWPYRVTRDEDYVVPENTTHNLIAETKKSLKKRKTGSIVRMEVDTGASSEFVNRLCASLDVRPDAIYRIQGPLDLTFLAKELYNVPGRDELRYLPFHRHMPRLIAGSPNVFDALHKGDVFLHHPYDSFDAVMKFVREAATDPRVLAINMTLYRVSGNSPVIKALCEAAEAGRRVTVLLELKARFDEENNIRWAEVLERSGCEVIYGIPRLKTHSKITLVVRREGDGLTRYVHLGTGNYNDVTAKLYTDMGLMTCDPGLGEDAQAFFNMITGFSKEPEMRRLIYAPRMLRQSLTALIEAEIAHARAGRPSGIFAKMNSLVDPDIIRLLYDASAAGVQVHLIIRGVCCLRAGVPGLSDNIQVRSLVGRFLEHSRVFCFENGGEPKAYLSSADWMPRNLNRRIELMFPVLDEGVRGRVEDVLGVQWRDSVNAWQMMPDGRYERVPQAGEPVDAQSLLFRED